MAINNVDMQDYEGNSYWTMANPDSISEFTKATTRTNIASGDTHRTIFGKICKFFADLGTSAFSGLANNLTTTAAGYGMDARQGPVIQQKFDQINSNISEVNQNLAGLPTVKAGITELTFSGGNTTLTHNAGFPDTNYAVMFICDNVRMFPRMSTNLDGNKTTLSASAVNGAGAIANLDGKYRVMWIVARSA